jgi:hypothetical protein
MSSNNQGRRSNMAPNKSLQPTPKPLCGFGAAELRRVCRACGHAWE